MYYWSRSAFYERDKPVDVTAEIWHLQSHCLHLFYTFRYRVIAAGIICLHVFDATYLRIEWLWVVINTDEIWMAQI